jgi:hypothetical protein
MRSHSKLLVAVLALGLFLAGPGALLACGVECSPVAGRHHATPNPALTDSHAAHHGGHPGGHGAAHQQDVAVSNGPSCCEHGASAGKSVPPVRISYVPEMAATSLHSDAVIASNAGALSGTRPEHLHDPGGTPPSLQVLRI